MRSSTGSCIRQPLRDGVEPVIAYFKVGDFFGSRFRKVESLARQRFDTDNQFLHAERFLQIIVGAEFKALYNVIDGGAGSEEKHRRVLVGLADAAYHLEAVHTGHHDVCHQHIGAQVEEQAQPLFAVGSGVDNETLPFQRVLYNHGEGLFILNQQYFYFIHDILVFLVILVYYVISVCTPGIYSCFS